MRVDALILAAAVCVAVCGAAEDWPTYLHDNARSGITGESLELPLNETWEYKSRQAPQPAWPSSAKDDWWHDLHDLRPVVTYDWAFHTVSAGDCVFFGSSADDKVYCLDAATGDTRWSFFTGAPVRLAPSIANGKVYFGSDDGWVYCLAAADGALLWKYRPSEHDRRIPGNGRIISDTPARTGVLVDGGQAFFCTGLFPSKSVYACVLEAAKGEVLWSEKTDDFSPQGYLLASPARFFIPQGRTNPSIIERETHKCLGTLEGPGGAYAVLVDDALASGPGRRQSNELSFFDTASKESIAVFPGIRMVVNGDMAYLQSKEKVSALNRTRYVELYGERNGLNARRKELADALKAAEGKDETEAEIADIDASLARVDKDMDACYLWEKHRQDPCALILAGATLFVGGEGKVRALDARDGAELWHGNVAGSAYGLSVANGRLFVSTDAGTIHCFATPPVDREHVVKAVTEHIPYPEDKLSGVYREAADRIVAAAEIMKGYCLVLGCGEGRLAYELAKRTELKIVGLERNAKKVAAARRALDGAGLYGNRVAVHQWEDARLPYTTYMANLVVSEEALVSGKLSVPAAEVFRVLRPYGGMACIGQPAGQRKLRKGQLADWLGSGNIEGAALSAEDGLWATIRRGELEGTGEWTQLYANASHTACSMDPLREPVAVQWFGEPGPREIIDRHHRPMSSLFKDGRLFVPADDLVYAVDPYNGTPLWQLDAPNSRRIGALKNCGHMLLTDEYLYVAVEDECWAVDVVSGDIAFKIAVPGREDEARDWGYINCVDNLLFGTGQRAGASFDQFKVTTCNLLEGDFRPVIVSEYLFCVDRHTGKKRWIHRKGSIMNSVITICDGRVYFVESRNENALADDDGRMRIDRFLKGETSLVALDLKTGKKAWQRPVELPFEHIAFLNGANGVLLASGTYNKGPEVHYEMIAFDTATGEDLWRTPYRALDIRGNEFAATGGSHGEQWQHPVIIPRADGGGTIYSRPFAFDLRTGAKKEYTAFRGGHGCGGLTGSAHYIFGRGDNPRMYPADTDRTHGIRLTYVTRPGCWLNIIPAGGLVMVPESSSGCTCPYQLQTSMAFIPKAAWGDGN